MSKADEFRRKAEEADRLAQGALSDQERKSYQKIAKSWRELEAAARVTDKRGI